MDLQIKKQCSYCNTEFTTKNPNKMYCSNTCRTYASLERNGKLPESQARIKGAKSPNSNIVDMTSSSLSQKDTLIASYLRGRLTQIYTERNWPEGEHFAKDDYVYDLEIVSKTDQGNYIVSGLLKDKVTELATELGIKASHVFPIQVKANKSKIDEIELLGDPHGPDGFDYVTIRTAYCFIISGDQVLKKAPALKNY